MERAGTLGPIWDPRAARSIGSISPLSHHIPPDPSYYIKINIMYKNIYPYIKINIYLPFDISNV